MASDRQIAANRLNSKKSTGPRTDQGKRSSRRNAIRHGLTAETIIGVLEKPADYEAFEEAIKCGYEPRTGVEYELVVRLASLLWRLRRTTAIESGLLQIHARALRDQNVRERTMSAYTHEKLRVFYDLISPIDVSKTNETAQHHDSPPSASRIASNTSEFPRSSFARAFLRLADLDNGVFDRLGRYETSLWRQAAQTIILLSILKHKGRSVRRELHRFRRARLHGPRFFSDGFYK